jgi:hypothetical protein
MARRLRIPAIQARKKMVSTTQVRQMINSRMEHKMFDDSETGTTATTGVVNPVVLLPQDQSTAGRTSDQIRPDSIHVRMSATDPSAIAGYTQGFVRHILFQDAHCRGAAPAVTDVLINANWNSNYNPVNILNNRFKVLLDHTFCLNGPGTANGFIEKRIKMKGIIAFVGTTALVASSGQNTPFLLTIGSNSSDTFDVRLKTTYTDA